MSALLLGSLFGAVCAKAQEATFSIPVFALRQTSSISVLYRSFLFPSLLAASALLRRSFLFPALFFLKGAVSTFTLSVFASQGIDFLCMILPRLVIQSWLMLPLQLYAGAVLLQDGTSNSGSLMPLLPMIGFALLGALLQIFLQL